MAYRLKKYINQRDNVWYDGTTNVLFTSYYLPEGKEIGLLKIVFKGGDTYMYYNVPQEIYIQLRESESASKAVNKLIKNQYTYVHLSKTDLSELKHFEDICDSENKRVKDATEKLQYSIEGDKETGKIRLKSENKVIFESNTVNVNIFSLLLSMGIPYSFSELHDELYTESDFIKNSITS